MKLSSISKILPHFSLSFPTCLSSFQIIEINSYKKKEKEIKNTSIRSSLIIKLDAEKGKRNKRARVNRAKR